ncbi:hypothetical protein C1N66_30965 (plasmid) [Bacillus cereus]|uniref:Aminoacyl-transfer RNA synthetases class-II family profile domain-containing protein n=1 Tax=Bacillus cereus TaxID=1396 RepID=A0AB73USZ5_BACCE|nr:aminoacyl--tRNA ligase-related protein [Bacillus cereus]QHV07982.1 hypothetical protein C1N82_32825 [Bacillus cereus]QHV47443.1 hypothetical protein C1N66_30965 [Bacillus cereus]
MEISLHIPEYLYDKVELLIERIPYLSEVITSMSYDEKNKVIIVSTKEIKPDVLPITEIKNHYSDLCKSLENIRHIKQKIVKSNLDSEIKNIDIMACHQKKKDYMVEREIALINQLDYVFIKIAQKYGAHLREYPSILNKNNMSLNKYHINFPQNIYGITSVPHNYSKINEFRSKANSDSYQRLLESTGEFLQPCICYHCYEELQGNRLDEGKILTGRGKCFRHEIEWRKNKFRRNEFTMREIVIFGEEKWVLNIRNQIMEEVWSFFESLGLKGKIVTATDPFFFSQDVKTKGTYQMMSNAKFELIVNTTNSIESSIASFNYCQDMLCSKYDIKNQTETALYSGCIAFGIDRWKEAIIDYYGWEWQNWPKFNTKRGS